MPIDTYNPPVLILKNPAPVICVFDFVLLPAGFYFFQSLGFQSDQLMYMNHEIIPNESNFDWRTVYAFIAPLIRRIRPDSLLIDERRNDFFNHQAISDLFQEYKTQLKTIGFSLFESQFLRYVADSNAILVNHANWYKSQNAFTISITIDSNKGTAEVN